MPQVNNNFMGYPMSGGFAYGPPQFGFGPGGSLIDAFHQRSFPSQAQLASAAFMPNPSGNDFSQYSMPQTTGASGFGAPPFPM